MYLIVHLYYVNSNLGGVYHISENVSFLQNALLNTIRSKELLN